MEIICMAVDDNVVYYKMSQHPFDAWMVQISW